MLIFINLSFVLFYIPKNTTLMHLEQKLKSDTKTKMLEKNISNRYRHIQLS